MKDFNKEEYNKICAEFMKIQYSELHKGELTTSQSESEWMCTYANLQYEDARDDFPFLKPMDYLKFDSDWNWIMEVVEKIESIYAVSIIGSHTMTHVCSIFLGNNESKIGRGNSKREAVIRAIWEFLNWYNQQEK